VNIRECALLGSLRSDKNKLTGGLLIILVMLRHRVRHAWWVGSIYGSGLVGWLGSSFSLLSGSCLVHELFGSDWVMWPMSNIFPPVLLICNKKSMGNKVLEILLLYCQEEHPI